MRRHSGASLLIDPDILARYGYETVAAQHTGAELGTVIGVAVVASIHVKPPCKEECLSSVSLSTCYLRRLHA